MSSQPDKQHDDLIVHAPSQGVSGDAPRDPANERTDDWTALAEEADIIHTDSVAKNADADGVDEIDTGESYPSTQPIDQKESDHSRSLRSKLVLSLALMLGVVVGIDEVVRQKVIAPEFANLERVAALKDTNRVLSAINTEVEFLAETVSQDSYRIGKLWSQISTATTSQSLPQSLSNESISAIRGLGDRVEWAAIVHHDGQWSWLATEGKIQKNGNSLPEAHSTGAEFPGIAERIALYVTNKQGSLHGMTRGSDGELYLFAGISIDQNADQQSATNLDGASDFPEAFYVVGRRFGDAVISDLEQRTSVSFSIRPITSNPTQNQTIEVDPTDSSLLRVVWPLLSPSGQPLAELNVQLPREVTSRSNRTTAFARYLSLCGASVSLLFLLLLLQRIVIGRLETIREHTERIAESGIISDASTEPVLQVAGHDEIGKLAQSFDRMRTRLGDAQRKLSDASHAAGMSLVADTVIHNVGNVLTNVNSLIETATRRVENLRIEPLEKLANRLRKDDVDEALQRATPDYLQRLSETLEGDKDELAALLQTLNDNIQHIHQVIRDQRRHANQPVKWQHLDLRTVVEEAVKCSQAKLAKDLVKVNFNSELDVAIWTDRSLLLQILINVIGNAGNATREIKSRQPTLNIDLIRTKTTAHVRFRDNGCGMDKATLSRVFDAHFTTRSSGSGLGLHFCAIAVKRIGGSIRAESDGPDQGATFIIELPTTKPASDNSPDDDAEGSTGQGSAGRPAALAGSRGNPGVSR
ncbi:MAG: HAMP domain-containing protein [Planctomycetales bacterium]|nr:HAMP domain-containing protein [Planctomycetales bacterium]